MSDEDLRQQFVQDGAVHGRQDTVGVYRGPHLPSEQIPVQGRDGTDPVPPPRVTEYMLGNRTSDAELEPTDPQAVLNQALAAAQYARPALDRAVIASMGLTGGTRPTKTSMARLLTDLDDLANRIVQLRRSLSTHSG